MTAVVDTQAAVSEKYVPLRVENGRVADGEFAGATVSTESRWDCVCEWQKYRGRPCFWQDGWLVHNPDCERSHNAPPEPLPQPGPYEARQIGYAELVASGHLDPEPWNGGYDAETAKRQAAARRGGDER